MAASGVMADFGRLPTSRKVLVFLVAGLLLGGLYYRFLYTRLAEEADEAREAYRSTAATHEANAASLRKYDELRPEMDNLRVQLARNQAALPTEAEVPAFFETLERKVKESGVEITKWTKRAEEPIETFVKVPVEIELTGTFMQIKRFFASLVQRNVGAGDGAAGRQGGDGEERERIVSIESLVISQPQVRNREIVLTAKLVAVTFRQDEKAAPARPGAPAAAPSGPPPPPPLRPRAGEPPAPAPGAAPGKAAPGAAPSSGPGAASTPPAGAGSARLQRGL